MTRDFNKQPRDDMRPSSRRPSPGRYGEERSSFPPRPRLNRETVDRAWESGAQQNHADYRARANNGQPARNNRYSNQPPSEHESFQNGRSNNRPYGQRQGPGQGQGQYRDNSYRDTNRRDDFRDHNRRDDLRDTNRRDDPRDTPYRDRNNNRRFERPSDGDQGPRSRSFQSGRRDFENPGERHYPARRDYADGQAARGPRPQGRDYPNNGQPRDRFSRPEGFNQDRDRPGRDFRRDQPGPGRSFERHDQPRDSSNPRWQSRPSAQRNDSSQPGGYRRQQGQQFDGDYEHFASDEGKPQPHQGPRPQGGSPRPQQFSPRPQEGSSSHRPFQGHQDRRNQYDDQGSHNRSFRKGAPGQEHAEPQERHVTQMPDGRVLKGSRPSQRKQAQFWQGVTEDTQSLIPEVETPETEHLPATDIPSTTESEQDNEENPEQNADGTPKKRRARPASAVARGKKNATAPRGAVPRPSRRGFQWPAP